MKFISGPFIFLFQKILCCRIHFHNVAVLCVATIGNCPNMVDKSVFYQVNPSICMDTKQHRVPHNAVAVFPLMALRACLQNMAGAYRAWLLLRTNSQPSGAMKAADFFQYGPSIGISMRVWKRWIKSAVDHGYIVKKTLIRRGKEEIILCSLKVEIVAKNLKMTQVGNQPVAIPIRLITQRNFAPIAWEAMLISMGSRTISRAALREITGVPITNQRRYEQNRGIQPLRNFAISSVQPHLLTGYKEFQKAHAFCLKIKCGDYIAYQIANTYSVAEREIVTIARGRTRWINKFLKAFGVNVGIQLQEPEGTVRIIHRTNKSLKQALNRVKILSIDGGNYTPPEVMYEYVPGITPGPSHFFREVAVV